MVNESDDKYEGQEEGEYHFSDDQVSYDVEPDVSKPGSAATAVSTGGQGSLLTKLVPYRRMLIGIVVFIVVMTVVYIMLSPGNPPQGTELTEAANLPPVAAPAPSAAKRFFSEMAPKKHEAPVVSQPPAAVQNTAVAEQQAPAQAAPAAPAVAQPTQQLAAQPELPPAVQMAAPIVQQPSAPTGMPAAEPAQAQVQTQAPAPVQAAPAGQSELITQQAVSSSPGAVVTIAGSPEAQPASGGKTIMDHVATLEEQNAKLMTTYAQKMADSEAQNNATQERIHELDKRLMAMEASLNRVVEMLQSGRAPTSAPPLGMVDNGPKAPAPIAKEHTPRMIYKVQAIIPGRAWLKSESGDTITVAEGDILKDYGRVAKIDPYDGIVDIDTGSKMIALSYGLSGD